MTIIGPLPFLAPWKTGFFAAPNCSAADAKSTRNSSDFARGIFRARWPGVARQARALFLFFFKLELRSEYLLRLRRHRRVVAEFDRVGALPAGHRPQPRVVCGHFGKRHHALDRHEVAARGGGACDLSALAREVGSEIAHESIRRGD